METLFDFSSPTGREIIIHSISFRRIRHDGKTIPFRAVRHNSFAKVSRIGGDVSENTVRVVSVRYGLFYRTAQIIRSKQDDQSHTGMLKLRYDF